jgi:hypothetical protein
MIAASASPRSASMPADIPNRRLGVGRSARQALQESGQFSRQLRPAPVTPTTLTQ